MLWTCVLLPSLPLEIYTRGQVQDDARPFAVTTGGHYPRIVAADLRARAAGVREAQLVSAALALAPDLVLRERDPAQERAALAAVATWTTQFTPTVALAGTEAIVADIAGSLRLFGGLRTLLRRLQQGLQGLGYAASMTCAPTPLGALLLARAGEPVIVTDPEALDARLAPLPLALLQPSPEALATLEAAGITTFGAACRLPRDALARRVGHAFVALLDRARGHVPDPQPRFVPPSRYQGRLDLPAPVADVEALAFAVNRLVHEMTGWLLGRALGVSAMTLTLAHERYIGVRTGIPATVVRFAIAAPAREPAHLIAVLRERLARVELPAPVESVGLASEVTAPLAGRNLGLLPDDDVVPAVPLLDRLRARLGEHAVMRVAPFAEHRPERAWTSAPDAPAPAHAARAGGQANAMPAGPRPTWLLSEPQSLAATFETTPWVLRDGPERIESGWWDGGDVRRDYYVAQSPHGETLWIYRDSRYGDDGEWFLHGVFA